jgi:cysteine desulfurase
MYGPKGMGALYVRRRPRVRLEALFSGGGQERGLRSGTLAPALCVGIGAAAKICREDLEVDKRWITHLSDRLKKYVSKMSLFLWPTNFVFVCSGIRSRIPNAVLNGDENARYPGNLNFSFAYIEGESLLMVWLLE